MKQIQSPAAGGGCSTRNHTHRGSENPAHVQRHSLESPLGKEIGLHFKTRCHLERRDLSTMKLRMEGVVKLQLNERGIRNSQSASTHEFLDFYAQRLFDHQLQDEAGIKITRDHESPRRSFTMVSTGVPGANSCPQMRCQRDARSDQSIGCRTEIAEESGDLRDLRNDKKSKTS
jgi:hypothetical protein